MLILYPKLPNGNVFWSCDNCDNTAEVSASETNAVALICMCDRKVHPHCNDKWYTTGEYFKRIPLSIRIKKWNDWNE